jgi:hypothetical protein
VLVVLRAAAGFAAFAVALLCVVAAATRASFFSVVDVSTVADFAVDLSEPTLSLDVVLLDLSPGNGLSASAVVSPASGRRGAIGADLSTGTWSGGTGLSSAVDFALGAGDVGAGDGAGGDSVDFAAGAGTVVVGDGVAVVVDDGDVGDGVAAVGGTVGRDATFGERVTSRRYGALIATATANTISTSSARNHVVAKIERGAVSS